MDNMLTVTGGIDLFRGVRMLIPPAWQNVETMDADLRAFYEYNSMHMEPWDASVGVVLTDGSLCVCSDQEWSAPSSLGHHQRMATSPCLGNRRMELRTRGRIGYNVLAWVKFLRWTPKLADPAVTIDNRLKSRHPYKQWMRKAPSVFKDLKTATTVRFYDQQLKQYMKMYQVTLE
jgi:glutamate synthase (NADPH/NADH) large chain